jgi:hypothetical protein
MTLIVVWGWPASVPVGYDVRLAPAAIGGSAMRTTYHGGSAQGSVLPEGSWIMFCAYGWVKEVEAR